MKVFIFISISMLTIGCQPGSEPSYVNTVNGKIIPGPEEIWLTHEHILVDFIGADSIDMKLWDHDQVLDVMMPYLKELVDQGVVYYVDATPQFLGRDVKLLQKLSEKSGIEIVTNTGLYGAVNNKYIPAYAYEKSAVELAGMWIEEYQNGIDGTLIKPGFIKISVDNRDTLEEIDHKIVEAAAITHLKTGLTIGSHTGEAKALWPQLEILQENSVPLDRFIWIHAQNEKDHSNYLRAAEMGCWISLDGLGWDIDNHLKKLLWTKENNILDHILISHDAGWYDPQKKQQSIKPYSDIFNKLKPRLFENGFTDEEWKILMSENPQKAFSLEGQ